MRKIAFLITSIFFCHGARADYCDVVITQKAYTTYSKKDQSFVLNSMRAAMCKVQWSNQQEFSNSANSAGVSIGYAAFTFGLSSSGANSDANVKQAYDKYCRMSDQDFISQFESDASGTIPDIALNAWQQCVTRDLATREEGLFLKVTDDPGRKGFLVDVTRKSRSGGNLELRSITSEDSVSCSEGKTKIEHFPYDTRTNAFVMHCTKAAAEELNMALNTNSGSVDGIHSLGWSVSLPDRDELLKRMQAIENEEDNIKKDLKALKDGSAVHTAAIASVNSRVSGIAINIARQTSLNDIGTDNGDGSCTGLNDVAYGFHNSKNWALDMWRCATIGITIPPPQ